MASQHRKRRLSLAIREIETTRRRHFKPTRKAKMKKMDNNEC